MMRIVVLLSLILLLLACSRSEPLADPGSAAAEVADGEFERGRHRGRLLRDGEFALEVTIFEANTPPHFRLYAYWNDQPLPPDSVSAIIELSRLDGQVDQHRFAPTGDFLAGSDTVDEPHSFDVSVVTEHAGRRHVWTFPSYEGRTVIPQEIAGEAGIVVASAGPETIRTTLPLTGVVALDSTRHAELGARFPGIVRAVRVLEGEYVRRGQTLAIIEGNDSLREYPLTAPFDGVVLSRRASVGDRAGEATLIELADLSSLWVELRAVGSDADRIAVGQRVTLAAATGGHVAETRIDALLPIARLGQSVIARARLQNPDGQWRPGVFVTAEVEIAAREVELAVRESGVQRFRDFTVVFAQVGDTYEVRMLELGQRDGHHAEVLSGLKPGTRYVVEQSYLIRADIEKSGASHDH
ncbi:MAG TPA: HlyD family secretion protein [Xanthomonadales bacterium]|nr:HlyD family secretion protein [Xanthomonadales bacterium]